MNDVTSSPFFGILLSIAAFELGIFINKKTKLSIASPILIAIIIVITVLKIFKIPLENYNVGGDIISLFLAPATASLAVSIYSQLKIIKSNFLPIVIGTLVGSITSVTSVIFLCKMLKLNNSLTMSLIPKSVTTPIAIEISSSHGGIVPVTVAVVIITGILGAILSPILIKIFKINNPIAAGIAIGTSSHAVGTSKAIEIGETEGAMSGVAIGIAGLMTVFISIFV